jgi:hypothetical protein
MPRSTVETAQAVLDLVHCSGSSPGKDVAGAVRMARELGPEMVITAVLLVSPGDAKPRAASTRSLGRVLPSSAWLDREAISFAQG